jgi:hypothetical protein
MSRIQDSGQRLDACSRAAKRRIMTPPRRRGRCFGNALALLVPAGRIKILERELVVRWLGDRSLLKRGPLHRSGRSMKFSAEDFGIMRSNPRSGLSEMSQTVELPAEYGEVIA